MDSFVTWDFIGTFAGSVAVVTVLTQIIKDLFRFDPKWIALAISAVVTFGVQLMGGDLSGGAFLLSGVNTFVVMGAAVGAYETTKSIAGLLRSDI